MAREAARTWCGVAPQLSNQCRRDVQQRKAFPFVDHAQGSDSRREPTYKIT